MVERAFHVAGAGLLALDVVMASEQGPFALTFAGGTCGNVLSILSYLEWTSSAIGFIGDDDAGARMLSDLAVAGVQSRHVRRSGHHSTPVFVQNLQRDETGNPRHQFTRQCPSCGRPLESGHEAAGDTPIREFSAEEAPHVFFMDRLSQDILALAGSAKARGALVFYEPSVRSDMRFWDQALALADVVKYSADRFDADDVATYLDERPARHAFWEVQTLGSRGLRYRRSAPSSAAPSAWKTSPALAAPRVVDTCGAGDWCSAGLLYGLLASDAADASDRFASALVLGQALAAWACSFVGARGAMYCNDRQSTWRSVRKLQRGEAVDVSDIPMTSSGPMNHPSDPWATSCWHTQLHAHV